MSAVLRVEIAARFREPVRATRVRAPHEAMEIADVHWLDAADGCSEPVWHIEGQNFDLRLRAASDYRRDAPSIRS